MTRSVDNKEHYPLGLAYDRFTADIQWRDRAGISPASIRIIRPLYLRSAGDVNEGIDAPGWALRGFSGEISTVKARLTWICHGATQSNRTGAFPADEPLEDRAVEQILKLAGGEIRADRVVVSPLLRARQTSELLGLEGETDPSLIECDYGAWAGRELMDVHASDPKAVTTWMSDPAAAPHGGESLSELIERVDGWLARQLGEGGHTIAVTHASVIRAAIVGALQAPPAAFWKIDVEPLSFTEMSSDGRRWTLRLPNRSRSASVPPA
jgi:broad specificity phosphatase PhoE